MSENPEIVMQAKHIVKQFPASHGRTLTACNDINLTMYKGRTLGIVGESGCGKSTFVRMVTSLDKPTSGEILYHGKNITGLSKKETWANRQNLQMVFQDPLSSFSPRMKIGTYLCEPRRNYDGISKSEAIKEAEELLEKVGLPREFVLRYPHELSGGQLQRVAIARAIAIKPELLICDEATGALDVSIQNQIARLLVELVEEQNMGCIFIGHDLALVRSVTQRIAVMYLGRMVELLDSEDLEQKCCHPYTKALLSAIPIADPTIERERKRILLQGDVPSPVNLPQGCNFCNRCPYATQLCKERKPQLREIEPGHFTACHRAEEM